MPRKKIVVDKFPEEVTYQVQYRTSYNTWSTLLTTQQQKVAKSIYHDLRRRGDDARVLHYVIRQIL